MSKLYNTIMCKRHIHYLAFTTHWCTANEISCIANTVNDVSEMVKN